MENIYDINKVGDYLSLRKQEVLHPLIGMVDFNTVAENGKVIKGYNALRFNCYAIFLKDAKGCKLKYGGKDYDYDEGTLVFVSPNQVVGLTYNDPDFQPKGYALLFHPDLLLGTELGKKMSDYSFFSYSSNEALHLSAKERKVILSVLDKIQFELEQNMDKHSKKLIVANIELFLDYCLRFYDRQFLTREVVHQGALEKFNGLLGEYFSSEKPQTYGLPSVGYFADQLHLSSNYFGDLVKKETGTSAQEYIQAKLIEVAKEKVFDPNKSVSEIAYELGFKYPQHFTRLFKQRVGHSPSEFRSLN
ncbi:helix-turn-helix domain-containing protein [Zobellia alginiliquefaciens]|uniref:helix-turn-helix domain-containing protein n=1 Tax=Zobellia alginiliquefaciens TaxID=3032586 RepID=UPI0023E2EE20|nr:helix-turn-helix transcriptional regulator [Zobellia alginiliquefaciens]